MTRQELITKINNNEDLSNLDVSEITDMSSLFAYNSTFNGDISKWNVINVTDMTDMFDNSIFTGDISKWNVKNVMYMREMFANSKFNGDISNWNVKDVINMCGMFDNSKFKGNISKWNISNKNLILFNKSNDIKMTPKTFIRNKINISTLNKITNFNTYKPLTRNKNTTILKFKDKNRVCILKTYTLNNIKIDLNIPKDVLIIFNTIKHLPNFISEDNDYYYFEYIDGVKAKENERVIFKKDFYENNQEFILRFGGFSNSVNNVICKNNKLIIIDFKFMLKPFVNIGAI